MNKEQISDSSSKYGLIGLLGFPGASVTLFIIMWLFDSFSGLLWRSQYVVSIGIVLIVGLTVMYRLSPQQLKQNIFNFAFWYLFGTILINGLIYQLFLALATSYRRPPGF